MSKRTFPISQVLSVTTGVLFCQIGDVHALLDFLTGEQLFTHQLPRACSQAQEVLRASHPHLFVDASSVNIGNVQEKLAQFEAQLGTEVELEPLPCSGPKPDPIQELVDMVGPEKVIVFATGAEP